MKRFGPSAVLNFGSLATFVALPLLYGAVYNPDGATLSLWGGFGLMLVSMAAPFVALKCAPSNPGDK